MSVINPPGFLQNAGATHTAEQFRDWQNLLIAGKTGATSLVARGGVHPALGNALTTTQTGSPSMAVIVKSGQATIAGTEGTKQGTYAVINDADVTLSIAAAHATLNRIDIVVFKIEDQAYSGAVNASSLAVVTGTPASSPSAPAAPNNSITVAQVAIAASVTSILNANITDTRIFMAATGGIISVAGSTEETALNAYESLAVYRRDIDRVDIYDSAVYRPYYPVYKDSVVLGGTQATVTFSNIPTNLRSVRISWTARSDQAANDTNLDMRINNDSTASLHRYEYMIMVNLANPTGSGAINNLAYLGNIPAASSPAGNWGTGELDLKGWNSPHANWLAGEWRSGYYSTNGIYTNGHMAYTGTTASYTSIVLFCNPGNFIAGSAFYLEGIYA